RAGGRLRPGRRPARGRIPRHGRREPRRSAVMNTVPDPRPTQGTPAGAPSEPARLGAAPPDPAQPDPAPTRRPRANGRFSLRLRGLWLVTSLELRQRIRSVRWYVAL